MLYNVRNRSRAEESGHDFGFRLTTATTRTYFLPVLASVFAGAGAAGLPLAPFFSIAFFFLAISRRPFLKTPLERDPRDRPLRGLSSLFIRRTTYARMPRHLFHIKRDCEGIKLAVAFSYRFVATARSVAAESPADGAIIGAEALHCLETPVGGVVVVVTWLAFRRVVVDVHSLAAQMQAG